MYSMELYDVAQELGVTVAEEYEHQRSFLERLGRFIKGEGARIARDVRTDFRLRGGAQPWAMSVLMQEAFGDEKAVRQPKSDRSASKKRS